METTIAVKVYQLKESVWSGDEYESPKERTIGSFLESQVAKEEKKRLEIIAGNKNPVYILYRLDKLLVEPKDLQKYMV